MKNIYSQDEITIKVYLGDFKSDAQGIIQCKSDLRRYKKHEKAGDTVPKSLNEKMMEKRETLWKFCCLKRMI